MEDFKIYMLAYIGVSTPVILILVTAVVKLTRMVDALLLETRKKKLIGKFHPPPTPGAKIAHLYMPDAIKACEAVLGSWNTTTAKVNLEAAISLLEATKAALDTASESGFDLSKAEDETAQ